MRPFHPRLGPSDCHLGMETTTALRAFAVASRNVLQALMPLSVRNYSLDAGGRSLARPFGRLESSPVSALKYWRNGSIFYYDTDIINVG